jgi:hypothetical protein
VGDGWLWDKGRIFSIYSKLEDLGRYFRDDGASVPQVIARALKTPDGRKRVSDFPIVVFNLEGISEKVRAIVLELILRNIAKYMYHRGPLAYLKELTLVIVVDEAYLWLGPMQHNGKIGEQQQEHPSGDRQGREKLWRSLDTRNATAQRRGGRHTTELPDPHMLQHYQSRGPEDNRDVPAGSFGGCARP